jgi:hypothetical protein
MKWFKSMFEESPGVASAARVILFLTFIVCIAAPIATAIHGSWGQPTWVKPDLDTLSFCKWAFTAALGGKVGQAIFGEKGNDPPAS